MEECILEPVLWWPSVRGVSVSSALGEADGMRQRWKAGLGGLGQVGQW